MKKWFLLIFVLCMIQTASAAHFIVGNVNDAVDGAVANGKEVVLWNPSNGVDDNLTDIVGPTGNSKVSNVYMIDCELLSTPCIVGDEIKIRLTESSQEVNLSVTGAGYDIAPEITLNSAPNITSIKVDDSLETPENEIDLVAASTRNVNCEIVVEELDSDDLQGHSSEFFHSSSSVGAGDDNNTHYTNNSCFINSSYGNENQTLFICGYDLEYYANPGSWECFFEVQDNLSSSGNRSDTTNVNTLLSVGMQDLINYSTVNSLQVSNEVEVNVTNYGNVMVNLSLVSYARSEGDGLAMNCTFGNISAEHQKYNLTSSNPGSLDLGATDLVYSNMSILTEIKEFNLDYRTSEENNEAVNSTYWRIYVPLSVGGGCQGKVIFVFL
jgi:hypothetical protein